MTRGLIVTIVLETLTIAGFSVEEVRLGTRCLQCFSVRVVSVVICRVVLTFMIECDGLVNVFLCGFPLFSLAQVGGEGGELCGRTPVWV